MRAMVLRRDPAHRLLAGVCAGLARRLGVDPLLVRVAFVAAGTTGLGIGLYLLLWVLVPADGAARAPAARLRTGRAAVEVGLGTGLLVLAALLTFRATGLWFSDAVVWPLVLVSAGGALLWRQAHAGEPAAASSVPPVREAPAAPRPATPVGVSRTALGVVLVLAAGLAFLQATGALATVRDAALIAAVVAVVLAVVAGPGLLRERAERVRAQERAEVNAHLHDSVLQTLALVQKRADDPRAVAALARRQERELRAWLGGRDAARSADLVSALEQAAADVESAHGVPVEVVAVGDRPLDEHGEALVAAAREAMVNAAKHAGDGAGGAIRVFSQVADGTTQVFVRDRGAGFDAAAVPADRRGISDSIVGRMRRHGGRAVVHTAPGEGTEVELSL